MGMESLRFRPKDPLCYVMLCLTIMIIGSVPIRRNPIRRNANPNPNPKP